MQTVTCIRPVPNQRRVVLAAQQPMQALLMIGVAVQNKPGVLRPAEQLLDHGAVVGITLDQRAGNGGVAWPAARPRETWGDGGITRRRDRPHAAVPLLALDPGRRIVQPAIFRAGVVT